MQRLMPSNTTLVIVALTVAAAALIFRSESYTHFVLALVALTTVVGVGHTAWRGRAPLVIAATIPVLILLALPWRATELPPIPGFSAMWLALLIGCDLLTVLLLFSQYRTGGSARLLALLTVTGSLPRSNVGTR